MCPNRPVLYLTPDIAANVLKTALATNLAEILMYLLPVVFGLLWKVNAIDGSRACL